MAHLLINFLKKTYKILIVLLAAVVFFLGYNMYLVDHSLNNLRFTLDKLSDVKTLAEAKKVVSGLDYSLFAELASVKFDTSNLARIEMAKDTLTNLQDMSRLKDAKFFISEVIKERERTRPPLLLVLDKINNFFVPGLKKVSRAKLEQRVGYLNRRLGLIKDKQIMQEIYYELGNIYTQLQEFEKAKESYRKVMEFDSKTKLAQKSWFNLAWNEKYRGNLDEAVKEFNNLVKTSTDEKFMFFSKYQLADAYRRKGDYGLSLPIYEEIIADSPDKDLASIAGFQEGSIYLYDLKDFEKAKEIFDKVKTKFKETGFALHLEKTAVSAIVRQYNWEGFRLLREGYKLSLPGKYKEAQKYFDKALELYPKDGVACIGKALVYLWLKDTDNALNFGKKAIKALPADELVNINLGDIYIQLGMFQEAIIL
ncbi:MAG: tetratricopeptide repeat protein [Candidatus Omnitrophica bacterium]|nr:tetratricopeptide repeat protein [Candidatus Omnitrophota bacterium]